MALYPTIQRRAQDELDCVVGLDRLPTPADREHLPYINALMKEILRWHPIAPTGLPHAVAEDDFYEGYFIPKGSVVIPNIWYFAHDPEVYHDPMDFDPSRFLGPSPEADPHSIVFGFGRRACPGKELASSSIVDSNCDSHTEEKEVDFTDQTCDDFINRLTDIVLSS